MLNTDGFATLGQKQTLNILQQTKIQKRLNNYLTFLCNCHQWLFAGT